MAEERTVNHVRQVCRICGRVHSGHSRHGIYFRCKHCGALNAGPRMIQEYGMAPPTRRRPARGAGAAVAARGGSEVAPAPRRRTFLEVLRGDAA